MDYIVFRGMHIASGLRMSRLAMPLQLLRVCMPPLH